LLLLLTNFLWAKALCFIFFLLLSREISLKKLCLPHVCVENARDLMSIVLRSDCFIEYTSSNRKRRRGDDDDNKIDFQITPEKQH
jgi:hypothetical protein